MALLALAAAVGAALLHAAASQPAPPPVPPHCRGDMCWRSEYGDVCTSTDCNHFGNV